MRYAFLALPFLLACDSVTGPERDRAAQDSASLIRFVLDGGSCQGTVSLDFRIDKELPEVRSLSAGDSTELKTTPGAHEVLIRGAADDFGAYGEWQALQVQAPVRVVLTC